MCSHEIKYHHVDEDDNELTLVVEFNYQPGTPGQYRLRPENCYPSTDPEIEITSIRLDTASTPHSRQHPRYRGHFNFFTPSKVIINALKQLDAGTFAISTVNTELYIDRCIALEALNQGGFIGPAQLLVQVEITDLLSDETITDIEAKCWEFLESA